MSLFLGVGLGPIQTGIFLSGAFKGGFDRLVIAEVDKNIVAAVRKETEITINIAEGNNICSETIRNLEIYNPLDSGDMDKLVNAAAEASELATALPGVAFFKHIAPWLKKGFELQPDRRRFIYTAENNNHAAEALREAVGKNFPNTYYLNTVIGKMSKVFISEEEKLPPLCQNAGKGHLVEAFNTIYISGAPGIEERKTKGLSPKPDLYPFEEAKLYGHNAAHFMLGVLAYEKNLNYLSEATKYPDIIEYVREAFLREPGVALTKKYKGLDDLFSPEGFKAYVDDLMVRMVNPGLADSVERVIRDIPRKLDINDRVIGTIRLCLNEGVIPERFMALPARLRELGLK